MRSEKNNSVVQRVGCVAVLVSTVAATGCDYDWGIDAPSGSGGAPGTDGGVAEVADAMVDGYAGEGGDSPTDAGATGGAGATGAGGSGGASTVSYIATAAECVAPVAPDPGACEKEAGIGGMTVDSPPPNEPGGVTYHAFVRFDVDPSLLDRSVDKLTLQLMVMLGTSSGSDHSGEVWQVTPFTAETLRSAVPLKLGKAPVAKDVGPVARNQVVTWELPVGVLDGSSVFLGIYPTSNDAVDYWKVNGPAPPQLIVDYH